MLSKESLQGAVSGAFIKLTDSKLFFLPTIVKREDYYEEEGLKWREKKIKWLFRCVFPNKLYKSVSRAALFQHSDNATTKYASVTHQILIKMLRHSESKRSFDPIFCGNATGDFALIRCFIDATDVACATAQLCLRAYLSFPIHTEYAEWRILKWHERQSKMRGEIGEKC